ncbi:MAG: hypothetical protein WA127_10965, partial [Methanothrix sp.]
MLLSSILPVSAETNQIIGGVSYTISAPLAPEGQSYSYSWSATGGTPLAANQSSFQWTAPLVENSTTVLIELKIESNGTGCVNENQIEMLVQPSTKAEISLKKDCRYSPPVRVGDTVVYTYNITNTGGVTLYEINLTDTHDWGPNCHPTRVGGRGGDEALEPGQSWQYECPYEIRDPANYTKLRIMASYGNRQQDIIEKLLRLRTRMEINLEKMRRLQKEFDPHAGTLTIERIQIAGINYTSYYYVNQVTEESLREIMDPQGNLNITYYSDPVSQLNLTTRYDPDGKILSEEEYYYPKPGTNEYMKIEYDNPSVGLKTITITDYNTGDTLIIIEDYNGIIISKEYKKTPGYMVYEEKYILKNIATVKAKTVTGQEVSDSDTYSLEVFKQNPVLSVFKDAEPDPVQSNGTINYTITYKNNGGQYAHEVMLKETYDENLEFIWASPAPDPGTIDTWTIGDLEKEESGKITIQARLKAILTPGSIITNRVDMYCKEGSHAVAWANTTVTGEGLVISKRASSRIIVPGEHLNYTIDYRNNGSVKQTDVVIHDYLDEKVDFKYSLSDPLLINESSGRHHWWYVGDMLPGSGGTIEIFVKAKGKDTFKDNADSVFNTYQINSSQTKGTNKTLETSVVHSLWIVKEANTTAAARGENITYTIKYGNSDTDFTAENVSITDTLPEVDFLGATPQPNFINGKDLTWMIGNLTPRANGTIVLEVHIPEKAQMIFDETSSVEGDGFVRMRKSLSTEEEERSLTNRVEIRGYYESMPNPVSSSSAVVTILGAAGTRITTSEHGSGHYEEDESSRLVSKNKSVSLKKDIFASYGRTTFQLPGKRSIDYQSLWSDRTSTTNYIRGEVVTENFMYADNLQKNSSFDVDMNQTVYRSEANYGSGIARISYRKNIQDSPQSTKEIDENYHGSFRVFQSVDSYGENVKYDRSITGKGRVSSDKRTEYQRSFEHGSGYYSAEESMDSTSIMKDVKMLYSPQKETLGSMNISGGGLWQEGMQTKNPEMGLVISEEIKSASYIEKEAEMDLSSLKFIGSFNGSMDTAILHGIGPDNEKVRLEQSFVGEFNIDTAISLHPEPLHRYVHVNIEKKAIMQEDNIVLFLINVTNDGSRPLKKLDVSDRLPLGLSFIDSSQRAEVDGQFINWTISSLDIGRTMTIKLRARVENGRQIYDNYVRVSTGYNETRIEAENHTLFEAYYQPLSCCPELPSEWNYWSSGLNGTPTNAEWGSWKP